MTPIVLTALVAVLAGLLLGGGALAARHRAPVSRQQVVRHRFLFPGSDPLVDPTTLPATPRLRPSEPGRSIYRSRSRT
jgi:hypothetical protein